MSRLDARHPLIENVRFIIVLEGGMKAANGLLGTKFRSLAFGSKHVTRSQKERWMLNKSVKIKHLYFYYHLKP